MSIEITDTLPIRQPDALDFDLGAPITGENEAWTAYNMLKTEKQAPGTIPPDRLPAMQDQLSKYVKQSRAYDRPLFPKQSAEQRAQLNAHTSKLLAGTDDDNLKAALTPEQFSALTQRSKLAPDPDGYRARAINAQILATAYGKPVKPDMLDIARDHYAKNVLKMTGDTSDKAVYAKLQSRQKEMHAADEIVRNSTEQYFQDTASGAVQPFEKYTAGLAAITDPDLRQNAENEIRLTRRRITDLNRSVAPIAQSLFNYVTRDADRADAMQIDTAANTIPDEVTAVNKFIKLSPEQQSAVVGIIAARSANMPEDPRSPMSRLGAAIKEGGIDMKKNAQNFIAPSFERTTTALNNLLDNLQFKSKKPEGSMTTEQDRAPEFSANFIGGSIKDRFFQDNKFSTAEQEVDAIIRARTAIKNAGAAATNPIKPSDSWIDKSIILAGTSLPYTMTAASNIGSAFAAMSMAGESYAQARTANPEADPRRQLEMATVSGAAQAVIERASFKAFTGVLKGNNTLVNFLTGKYGAESALRMAGITSKLARGAAAGVAGVAATTVTEYGEEMAQDFTDRGLQDLAIILSDQDPTTDYHALLQSWKPTGENGTNTILALLPYALVGGAGASFAHFNNGAILSKNVSALRAVGVPEAKIQDIVRSPDIQTADKNMQEAFDQGLDIRALNEEDRARKHIDDHAEGMRIFTNHVQELSKETGTKLIHNYEDEHSPTGESYELTLPGLAPQIYTTEQDAHAAFADWYEAERDQDRSSLTEGLAKGFVDFFKGDYQAGENVEVNWKDFRGSLANMVKKGIITQKKATIHLELYALEQGMTMPELQKQIAAGRGPIVMARSFAKKVAGGATKYFVDLFKGADPLDVTEDFSESYWKAAFLNGLLDERKAILWLHELREKTGYQYLPDNYTFQLDEQADLQDEKAIARGDGTGIDSRLIEGLSKASVQYLLGNMHDDQLPKGFADWIEQMIAILGKTWTWARQLMASGEMKAAIRDGKIDKDFIRHLSDSVGLNETARQKRAELAAQEENRAAFLDEYPKLSEAIKGKLMHPETARKRNDPLWREMQRIYDSLVTTSQKQSSKGKHYVSKNVIAAENFFAPRGEYVNLDDLRGSLEEMGFGNIETIGDMLTKVEDAVTGKESYATMANIHEVDSSFSLSANDQQYMTLARDPEQNKEALQTMVDEKAKEAGYSPRLFYHGTQRNFNSFDINAATRNDYGRFGRGFYFTKEKRVAAIYAGKNPFSIKDDELPPGAIIHSVYLNAKNFKTVDARDIEMPQSLSEAEEITRQMIAEGYDGIIGTVIGKVDSPNTEYVVFKPSQIKSADPVTYDEQGNIIPLSKRFNPEENSISFSLSKPLDNMGDGTHPRASAISFSLGLSAIHNLTSENLAYADEMGGLAVPSIAVVPTGQAIEGFGEITLIGGRPLADPELNPVYDADAYTKRFPRPIWKKVKYNIADALVKKLKPFSVKFDGNSRSLTSEIFDNAVNHPDPEKAISSAKRSPAAMAAYLSLVHNIEIESTRKPAEIGLKGIAHPIFSKYLAENGKPNLAHDDIAGRKKLTEAFIEAEEAATAEAYASMDEEPRTMLIDMAKKRRAKDIGDDGLLYFSFEQKINAAIDKLGTTVIDHEAVDSAITEAMQSREAEFYTWIENEIRGIYSAPMIKVRNKMLPYTLENIVEEMTHGSTAGAEKTMTFSEGQIRAMNARRFKGLEEMRRFAENNIQTEQQVKEHRKELSQRLSKWRDAVSDHYKYNSTFDALDNAMQALGKFLKGARTPARLSANLRAADFKDIPDHLVNEGIEIGELFMQAPVPYFESKPQRIVKLDEFKAAIVPDNADQETIDILTKHGISVYQIPAEKRKDADAFTDAVNEAAKEQNISFSLGGPTAKGIDKAINEGKAFLGIDDKVRFEMDASQAKMNSAAVTDPAHKNGLARLKNVSPIRWFFQEGKKNHLGTILSYDELFQNYPQLAGLSINLDKDDGGIGALYSVYVNGKFSVELSHISLDPRLKAGEAVSVLLHEAQHAIQRIEGYNAGGSPKNIKDRDLRTEAIEGIVAARDAAFASIPEEFKESARKINRGDDTDGTAHKAIQQNPAAKLAWANYTAANKDYLEVKDSDLPAYRVISAYEQYLNLPGEIEARGVQARASMTAAEREATPFMSQWGTFSLSRPQVSALEEIIEKRMNAGPDERARIYENMRTRLLSHLYKIERRDAEDLTDMEEQLYGWKNNPDMTDIERERLRIEDALDGIKALVAAAPQEIRAKIEVPLTRILNANTERKTVNAFAELIEKIDEVIETHLRAEYRAAIENVIEMSNPAMSASGQKKGKLTPATQILIDQIAAISYMTVDELALAQIEIDGAMAQLTTAIDEANTDEQRDQLEARLQELVTQSQFIHLFGGMEESDSKTLAQAKDEIVSIYKTGRYARKLIDEEDRKELERMRKDVMNSLDLPNGADQPTYSKATDKKGAAMIKQKLKNISFDLFDLHTWLDTVIPYSQFGRKLSVDLIKAMRGTYRRRRAIHEAFNKFLADDLGATTTRKRNTLLASLNERKSLPVEIAEPSGWKKEKITIEYAEKIVAGQVKIDWFNYDNYDNRTASEDLINRLNQWRQLPAKNKAAQQFIELVRVTGRAKPVAMHLSQMEIVYWLQLAAQTEYGTLMKNHGLNETVMEELRAELTPAAGAIMRYMRRSYDDNHADMNQVFMDLYNMPMPSIRNYAPGQFESKNTTANTNGDPNGGEQAMSAMSIGATKNRRAHNAKPRQISALNVFFGHHDKTTYWIEYAELARDMRAVMMVPHVRRALEARHGTGILQQIKGWIDTIDKDGANDMTARLETDTMMQGFLAAQSTIALTWNLSVPFKQLSAALGSMWFIRPSQALPYLFKALSSPASLKKVWNSEAIQSRIYDGFSPEDKELLNSSGVQGSQIMRDLAALNKAGRLPMSYADAYFTTMSGAIAYEYQHAQAIKEGKSEAQAEAIAMGFMDMVIARSSQPNSVQFKSLLEINAKGIGKALFMFKSDPRKQMALFLSHAYLASKGKYSKAQLAEEFAVQWAAYGLLFQLGSSVFQSFVRPSSPDNDDLDEIWDWKNFAAAAAAGPIEGIAILGSAAKAIINKITGAKTYTNNMNPAENLTVKAMAMIKNGRLDLSTQNVLTIMASAGSFADKGQSLTAIPAAWRGVTQLEKFFDGMHETDEEETAAAEKELTKKDKAAAEIITEQAEDIAKRINENPAQAEQIISTLDKSMKSKVSTILKKSAAPEMNDTEKKIAAYSKEERPARIAEIAGKLSPTAKEKFLARMKELKFTE